MCFFGLSDKAQAAIFEFQRTSYDEDGKPIRFALTVYPADRNQFEMEAGRVPAPDTTTPDASAPTEPDAGLTRLVRIPADLPSAQAH